jgi:hypothetical protein
VREGLNEGEKPHKGGKTRKLIDANACVIEIVVHRNNRFLVFIVKKQKVQIWEKQSIDSQTKQIERTKLTCFSSLPRGPQKRENTGVPGVRRV